MVDKIWYNMEELIGGSEERVLIETYWNVNLHMSTTPRNLLSVLIETYWNVNYQCRVYETYGKTRINRNILECKLRYVRREFKKRG